MKTSAYKPTLTDLHIKRIEELKKEGSLTEKQQKKLDVLTMTHAGEKRETIAEKLGINMDTITEWKKLFVKEGMEVYLGLQKAVATVKANANAKAKLISRNVKKTAKRVVKNVKQLEKKVEAKTGATLDGASSVKEKRSVETQPKISSTTTVVAIEGSTISQIEKHIVEVLKNSYESVAKAIQTYSQSHGIETKKKILETYKKELKHAKKLIKEWTEKVKDLKKDMEKKDKKNKKDDKKEGKKKEKKDDEKKDIKKGK